LAFQVVIILLSSFVKWSLVTSAATSSRTGWIPMGLASILAAAMRDSESGHGNQLSGRGTDRAFFLPRLPREYYQGDAVVHWTLPIAFRQTGWLDERFHAAFRELLLHTAARESLVCPTYCLMPDHLHLVWMGLRQDTDQLHGMAFLRTHLKPTLMPHRFQHQAHDHVLKEEERKRDAFARVCFYIVDNARAAELVKHPKDWPFTGAVVPGYPTLHPLTEGFWPTFWKFYTRAKSLNVGKMLRPPIQ
jgi:putative transposase